MTAKKVYKKGVTLIEMLITISIIGILVGVITPSISKYLPGISLNGAAKVLTSNLREAQEKTITEQKQYLIRFHTDGAPDYYELIRINNSAEELQRTVVLKSGESLTLDNTIAGSQIVFSPDGGPSSSGDISISNATTTKIINVSPAGFIAIK